MGGRGAGSTGSRQNQGTQQRTAVSAQWLQQAQSAINGIQAGRRNQTISFRDPTNGHDIQVDVQLARTRNYWGRAVGPATYTVRVDDETNGDRLYYNYGIQSIGQVRNEVRRYGGVNAAQSQATAQTPRQQSRIRLTFQSVGNGNWQGHTAGVGGGQILDETGSSRDPNNGRSGRLYSARAWDGNYNSVGSTTYHSSLNEAKRAIRDALARQRNT